MTTAPLSRAGERKVRPRAWKTSLRSNGPKPADGPRRRSKPAARSISTCSAVTHQSAWPAPTVVRPGDRLEKPELMTCSSRRRFEDETRAELTPGARSLRFETVRSNPLDSLERGGFDGLDGTPSIAVNDSV